MRRSGTISAVSLIGLHLAGFGMAQTVEPPSIRGSVTAKESDESLAGCSVGLEGEEHSTRTDRAGRFSIVPGFDFALTAATLVVACPGREPLVIRLEELPVEEIELRVSPRLFSDRIEVVDGALEAQVANELDARSARVAISSSVAEALDASSSAVVLRTLGEADQVSIRGVEPRLVATRIEGEAIPAFDGASRVAGLSTLPLELFDSVTISTSFSPDSDADAIGGVVDLRMPSPTGERILEVFGTAGAQDLNGSTASSGARIAGRGSEQVAWQLGAIGRTVERGADARQQRWDGGSQEREDLRDHEFHSEQAAFVGGITFDLTSSTRLTGKGLANHARSRELRWRTKYDYADGEIEREVKDAGVLTRFNRFSLGLDHQASPRTSIGATLVFNGSLRSEPERADTSFLQEGVLFDESLQPINESLDGFSLDKVGLENNRARDHTFTLGSDLISARSPWRSLVEWKLGAKARKKSRFQDNNTTLLGTESHLSLSEYLGSGDHSLFRGRQSLGWVVDPYRAQSLPNDDRITGAPSLAEDAGDFDAGESSGSAYLQGRFEPSMGLQLVAGLRWEAADADYRGYVLEPLSNGDELTVSPSSGAWQDDALLPAILVNAELTGKLRLSGGISRTFSRPDFYDLVPYELIDLDDSEIERGNPSLRSTRAWNYDLELSWQPVSSLRVRGNLFAKDLSQIIFRTTQESDLDGEVFDVTSLANGDRGALLGAELELEASPSWLPGFRLDFSGTITDSSADLDGRPGQRLPGQASHSLFLQLSYATGPWSIGLQGKRIGGMLWEVGNDETSDVWRDAVSWLDFSAHYRLKRLSLALDLRNLTDERDRLSANGRLRAEELGGRTLGLSFRIRR